MSTHYESHLEEYVDEDEPLVESVDAARELVEMALGLVRSNTGDQELICDSLEQAIEVLGFVRERADVAIGLNFREVG